MPITVRPTEIPDVLLLEPKIYPDARGLFFEGFRQDEFAAHGFPPFVQDNYNVSAKGVIRALHYQIMPRAQGKLVRAVRGAIFDVAVDLRKGSNTFGRWIGVTLNDQAHRALYIPPGFAHGFCALEDETAVMYKVTELYSPAHERGVRWDDPALGIVWPALDRPYQLSDRDRQYPVLADAVLQ